MMKTLIAIWKMRLGRWGTLNFQGGWKTLRSLRCMRRRRHYYFSRIMKAMASLRSKRWRWGLQLSWLIAPRSLKWWMSMAS